MVKNSLNLPIAINWWSSILENRDIPVIQQLAMFHIICRLNKNFWQPAQISMKKLAAVMNSDARTVKAAVDALRASNFVVLTEEGININVDGKLPKIESQPILAGAGDNQSIPDNVRELFG